ncbi:hypothetical protein HMPREF1318_2501 [Actinomyces massiliensis F0489]|uniref:Uncharacterized protein n=1 Tax=Actinomyces massiliensis F0489 TaxID=1125718 RepID=J1HG42_9ACTO|nr:hypothetical protein HMPREF1318_2501 [Actinomyces massiliensis F0489]
MRDSTDADDSADSVRLVRLVRLLIERLNPMPNPTLNDFQI